MTPILLPTPKYQFSQVVFIIGSDSRTTYKPCYVCKGHGKVGVPGCSLKAECPQCKGRGHAYEEGAQETTHFVAGSLTIRRCMIELVAEPKKDSIWSSDHDRLAYQGEMRWTESVPKDKRGWNVFREETCFETLAEVEAEVEARNHKGEA